MTLFGDIKEIKNINLSGGEYLTVPDGEIWKITGSIAPREYVASSTQAACSGRNYAEINNSLWIGEASATADSDHLAHTLGATNGEAMVKEGDVINFNYQDENNWVESDLHLSIIVMEGGSV